MAVNPYDGAGYGCGIGYGYCGTPASAALDILASVGTSTSKLTSEVTADGHGRKSVTGVGFQPLLIVPFSSILSAPGVSTAGIFHGIGCGTGSLEGSAGVASRGGVATSQTKRRHSNAGLVSFPLTTASDSNLNASLYSLDSDGFTYDYSYTTTAAYILNHIALGGADLEVSLTQHQMNATNADESFAHGLSGEPTGMLFFSAINTAAPTNTASGLYTSIGAWSSSGQFDAALFSNTGVTTTSCRRRLSNASVLSQISTSTQRSMAVSGVDATNVNCTYTVTTHGQQYYFWMLAIRGAKCQTGTFDCNGSTDPLSISCTGITPKLFMPVFVPLGVDTVNTVLNSVFLTIGASDGTNNVSCGITDQNGVTTTNARRYQSSNSFEEYEVTGAQRFEATASFSGESVVVTPTLNTNTSFGQGAYIIIGA